jgi:hypothetical protein
METTASVGTIWTSVFGEALTNVSSPGARRRNRKLHALTPEGTHLDVESTAWLTRHQEKAQTRLERKVERKMVHLRKPHKADGAATGNVGPLQCLVSGTERMPTYAERGSEPQVVAFELDALAERYRESLWERDLRTLARPGLVEAGKRMRERFLLCALSRAPAADTLELLALLRERGLVFDFAFALPPPAGGRAAVGLSPVLDFDTMRSLRDAMGMTVAAMERRLLAVLCVELEEVEIDARLPTSPTRLQKQQQQARANAAIRWGGATGAREVGGGVSGALGVLGSAAGHDSRCNVRMWLPGVTTLLVPHPRLQESESTVRAPLIADVLINLHRSCPRDWAAAHAARPTPLSPLSSPNRAADAGAQTSPMKQHSPTSGHGRGRTAFADYCTLGGLAHLVVPSVELAKCGLAPTRLPPPRDDDAAGGSKEAHRGSSSASTTATPRHADAAKPPPSLGCLSVPEPCDAKLFVLCVQRMQRKRRETRQSIASILERRFGQSPTGAADVGEHQVAGAFPAAFLSSTAESDAVIDPLGVEPFEVWSTECAAEPLGAPKASAEQLPPPKSKGRKGRGRR